MKRIVLCVLAACHGGATTTTTANNATKIDTAGMDRSVAPGDDFYAFANGGWLKSHEIAADRVVIGTGQTVFDETQRRTAELIKTADTAAPGTEARKIGDLYASYMDEAAIEAKGIAPLAPILEQLTAVTDEK